MKKEKIKILLVDDEPDIIEIIAYNFSKEGYQVFSASDGKEAITQAAKIIPHLIILDVMMPVMDGIEACENLRENPFLQDTIIMFLSARSEDYSQVAAFDVGADDYVSKPIKPKLLISKVNALLRRFFKEEKKNATITYDNLIIDLETYKVTFDEKEILLPKKEFELLWLLASQPDKVFGREEILKHIWGIDVVVGGRTIDVHIRKLREKIGDTYFKTIKGVGYKFVLKKTID